MCACVVLFLFLIRGFVALFFKSVQRTLKQGSDDVEIEDRVIDSRNRKPDSTETEVASRSREILLFIFILQYWNKPIDLYKISITIRALYGNNFCL